MRSYILKPYSVIDTENNMTKTEQAKAAAIQALLDAGFAPDGETPTETVRVPTRNSPLFGKSGGELATFGGRLRFSKAGTDIKATVGTRTTYLYRSHNGISGIAHLDTKNIEGVKSALMGL